MQGLQRDHPDLEDHPLLVHNATVFKEGQDALQVQTGPPAVLPIALFNKVYLSVGVQQAQSAV